MKRIKDNPNYYASIGNIMYIKWCKKQQQFSTKTFFILKHIDDASTNLVCIHLSL